MISLIRADLPNLWRIGVIPLSTFLRRSANHILLLNLNLQPTVCCLYSNSTSGVSGINKSREIAEPERSYLEEILEESREQPRTTGQKGFLVIE